MPGMRNHAGGGAIRLRAPAAAGGQRPPGDGGRRSTADAGTGSVRHKPLRLSAAGGQYARAPRRPRKGRKICSLCRHFALCAVANFDSADGACTVCGLAVATANLATNDKGISADGFYVHRFIYPSMAWLGLLWYSHFYSPFAFSAAGAMDAAAEQKKIRKVTGQSCLDDPCFLDDRP